jgi:hypothetical protein
MNPIPIKAPMIVVQHWHKSVFKQGVQHWMTVASREAQCATLNVKCTSLTYGGPCRLDQCSGMVFTVIQSSTLTPGLLGKGRSRQSQHLSGKQEELYTFGASGTHTLTRNIHPLLPAVQAKSIPLDARLLIVIIRF